MNGDFDMWTASNDISQLLMIFGIVVVILQTFRSFRKTGVIMVFTGPFEGMLDMLRTFFYNRWTGQRPDLFSHSDIKVTTSEKLVRSIN